METKFVSDGAELKAPEELLAIVTASRLLEHLGVTDRSLDRQREAVSLWLQTNLPNEILRASLGAAGMLPWGGRQRS